MAIALKTVSKLARSAKINRKSVRNVRTNLDPAPFFEPLEYRQMLSVAVDSAGWTQVGKSSDSRVVYVSSSEGSDSNNGLSQDSPVKSINKARSLLRNGMPDQMLLKRGDTWHESFGTWTKSGRDADEPMLISAYGSGNERPVLKTGNDGALDTNGRSVHDLAIIGIEMNAHTRDPESSSFSGTDGENGLRLIGNVDRVLVEDCVIDNYAMNISIGAWEGSPDDISIRRNVITDSYAATHSSGIYATRTNGLTIEGNLIDRNGYTLWHSRIEDLQIYPDHGVYLQASVSDAVIRDNIISNSGSHGLQARGGGIVKNNLFLKNPIGMSFGVVNGANVKAGGVEGEIAGNVFLDNRDIEMSSRGWGWAIEVGNTAEDGNTSIRDNIIANDSGQAYAAFMLHYGSNVYNNSEAVGINDLTISDNVVYDWYRGINFASGLTPGGSGYRALNDLTVANNDFQENGSSKIIYHGNDYSSSAEDWSGNDYYDSTSPSSGWFLLDGSTLSVSSWASKVEPDAENKKVSYSDPGRDIADYNESLGGARSTSAFLDDAREQSKGNWSWKHTANAAVSYVAAGYDRGSSSEVPSDPEPTPQPEPTPTEPEAPTTEPTQPTEPAPADTTGPRVTSFQADDDWIKITFSEDVSASLSREDILLKNRTTDEKYSTSDLALTYDKATNTATVTFPGMSGQELSRGSYRLWLYDQNVSDDAGNRLEGDAPGTTGDYIKYFSV